MMMEIARVTASRSTCSSRIKVGAVAVRNRTIISMGYNGVPSGLPHCDDAGCMRGPDGKHLFLIHAEENVIINAAREGQSLAGATLYITHFPCSHCAAMLAQAKVKRVVYGEEYGIQDTASSARYVFNLSGIEVEKHEKSDTVRQEDMGDS